MDPITILGVLAPQIIGGLVKLYGEHEAAKRAQDILDSARNNYGKLDPTTITRAAQEVLPPTALASIQIDPSFRSAQRAALTQMQDVARSGGLDLTDRANLNAIQNDTAHRASQARQGLVADLSARGMAGSGAEIAAQLAGQQEAANRNSQAGLQIAGDARRRALAAMMQSAQLAGQMGDSDWNRKAQVASAQDEISRLNRDQRYRGALDTYNAGLARAAGMSGYTAAQAPYAYNSTASGYGQAGNAIQQGGNMIASKPASDPTTTDPGYTLPGDEGYTYDESTGTGGKG